MADRKTVLITGASSGLGAEMARHMVDLGWRVFGTSRKPRAPEQGIEWLALDVCDDDSVDSALARLFEEVGHLDGLVCNAGFGIYGSVEETPLERARAQFETNFFGVLRVLTPVLTRMREANSGRILLVGSLAGRAPIPFQAHYSASKAAIEALAFSLANELDPFDVSVSLIEPGDINTPFNDVMELGRALRWVTLRRAVGSLRTRDPRIAAQEPGARDRGRGRRPCADREESEAQVSGRTRGAAGRSRQTPLE